MKKVILLSLFIGSFGLLGCNGQSKSLPPSFDQQLKTFIDLGFKLNDGIDTSDIDRWGNGQKEFEDLPYHLMYMTLGQTIEREPWTPITNQCWDFDLEAIEGHGAYVEIMKNMSRISNNELVFDNLKDFVDFEEGIAWVSFTCNNDYYKWDLKVDDDWADESLFFKVQSLARKYNTKGKFTFFNTGGQNIVLGYSTSKQLKKLTKATGLEIDWL